MPASACVSTSSVTNTFVTPSRKIIDSAIAVSWSKLVKSNSRILVLRRHVRQNHLIAHLQSVHHFDRGHGAAAEFHGDPRRALAVFVQLEQAHLRVLLP